MSRGFFHLDPGRNLNMDVPIDAVHGNVDSVQF